MSTVEVPHEVHEPKAGVCLECGRPFTDLTPEEVEEKLASLEPVAVMLLESQMGSRDQRVAQAAAKMLLEWKRGKPNQRIAQTTDQITTIRYESAAWLPEEEVIEVAVIEEAAPELTP
jgi:hypothetical protein